MMAKKKLVKIGFDLDGVIINKPPFIPNNIIEWLYRSHSAKKLSYRYPNTKFEKQVRQLSHHPLLRPPLKSNLAFIRNLSKNKKYKLYAISSRYSFLQSRTEQWFKKNNLEGIFEKVYLNTSDEQPHLFKERILNKLKPDIFIEDDPCVVDYLKDRLGKIKIRYLESGEGRVDELLGKRKPKILIGISYYLPNISGLTIYAQNLAEELVKREHVVKVLTSKHLKKLPESEEKNGVLIKRVWTPFIFGRGPIMPTYLFEAYRTIKKADVVNLHLPQFEAFFSALLAKLLKKKLVVTYHCDFSNWPGLINQITEKVA
ncbi:glycosyltransferase, partial [Patescibacteria group bacterium]|nr:glycosyltransferase [Patescibacteria group bacterium]